LVEDAVELDGGRAQEARQLTQLLTRLNSRMEAILQQRQAVAIAS